MINTALAFSGGKDSFACLWATKKHWDDILVIWVNTGKNFPEVLASINLVRALVPNFLEIPVDIDKQQAANGFPVDIMPVDYSVDGQKITGEKPVLVQPYLKCCYDNIAVPLNNKCKELGIQYIICGQRDDEKHTASRKDGQEVDGLTYLHPIEDWTEDDVLEFNAMHMDIPDHFQFAHSSMDCFDCTAYKADTKDIKNYMRQEHPILFARANARQLVVDKVISDSVREYQHV